MTDSEVETNEVETKLAGEFNTDKKNDTSPNKTSNDLTKKINIVGDAQNEVIVKTTENHVNIHENGNEHIIESNERLSDEGTVSDRESESGEPIELQQTGRRKSFASRMRELRSQRKEHAREASKNIVNDFDQHYYDGVREKNVLMRDLKFRQIYGSSAPQVPAFKSGERSCVSNTGNRYGGKFSAQNFTSTVSGSPLITSQMKLTHMLNGHKGCVNALDFNEDGSLLVSGSDDMKIIIWNWYEKKKVTELKSRHFANIFQTKFLSPSISGHELRVVSTGLDGQVRLCQMTPSGGCRLNKRLGSHASAAHKLTLVSDQPQVFLTCGEDGVVMCFDIRCSPSSYNSDENERTRTTSSRGIGWKLASIVSSQCSSIIRSVHESNSFPRQPSPMSLFSIDANPFNPNEICLAGEDKWVRVIDRRYLKSSSQRVPEVSEPTFDPMGNVITPHNSNICKAFCPKRFMPTKHRLGVLKLANSSGDSLPGDHDSLINLSSQLSFLSTPPSSTCAVYSKHTGSEIVASYRSDKVYLFSNSNSVCNEVEESSSSTVGCESHSYFGHQNAKTIKGVNFLGDKSEYVISGSDCGHIFIWDKVNGHIVKVLSEADRAGIVNVIETHPSSPVIATSGLDHNIKIWQPTHDRDYDAKYLEQKANNAHLWDMSSKEASLYLHSLVFRNIKMTENIALRPSTTSTSWLTDGDQYSDNRMNNRGVYSDTPSDETSSSSENFHPSSSTDLSANSTSSSSSTLDHDHLTSEEERREMMTISRLWRRLRRRRGRRRETMTAGRWRRIGQRTWRGGTSSEYEEEDDYEQEEEAVADSEDEEEEYPIEEEEVEREEEGGESNSDTTGDSERRGDNGNAASSSTSSSLDSMYSPSSLLR